MLYTLCIILILVASILIILAVLCLLYTSDAADE